MKQKKISDALRERADFLNDKNASYFQIPFYENKYDVLAALYEMADVIDSWSGEILSKEDFYFLNQQRYLGRTIDENDNPVKYYKELPTLTNEDRHKNVKKLKNEVKILRENKGKY